MRYLLIAALLVASMSAFAADKVSDSATGHINLTIEQMCNLTWVSDGAITISGNSGAGSTGAGDNAGVVTVQTNFPATVTASIAQPLGGTWLVALDGNDLLAATDTKAYGAGYNANVKVKASVSGLVDKAAGSYSSLVTLGIAATP